MTIQDNNTINNLTAQRDAKVAIIRHIDRDDLNTWNKYATEIAKIEEEIENVKIQAMAWKD
jgi:hypothetical protein